MKAKPSEQVNIMEDPNALLENALIEEYPREKGYSHEGLKKLPADLVEKLMKEATRYASLKMEEVQARMHFINDLHEDASSLEK